MKKSQKLAQALVPQIPTWFNNHTHEIILGLEYEEALFTIVDCLGRLVSFMSTKEGFFWYNRDLEAKTTTYENSEDEALKEDYKLLLSITHGRYIVQAPYI